MRLGTREASDSCSLVKCASSHLFSLLKIDFFTCICFILKLTLYYFFLKNPLADPYVLFSHRNINIFSNSHLSRFIISLLFFLVVILQSYLI